MQLSGKSAIVTGAAQGIGFAIARRYLNEGARVLIADINDQKGQKAVADLSAFGEVEFVHCDVGDRLHVHNLVATAMDVFGEIDILVNNAGIVVSGDFLEISERDFDAVMRVNLKGSFLCSQAVAKHMITRVKEDGPAGTIINMSSTNAVLAIPNQVPYSISKGAVRQLTNVSAQALAPWGIRVNAIGPGSIATEMLETVNSDPEAKQKVMSRIPMLRIGEAEEIAGIALFLASGDSGYITGQTIYADGGRLGQAYPLDN